MVYIQHKHRKKMTSEELHEHFQQKLEWLIYTFHGLDTRQVTQRYLKRFPTYNDMKRIRRLCLGDIQPSVYDLYRFGQILDVDSGHLGFMPFEQFKTFYIETQEMKNEQAKVT